MAMRALPRLPRNVVILAFTSFCADVSSEMLRPVLPLFLTQQLGAPASVVGLVEGIAEGTQNAVPAVSRTTRADHPGSGGRGSPRWHGLCGLFSSDPAGAVLW